MSNLSADVWLDCEMATFDNAGCQANDHYNDGGTNPWTTVNGHGSMSASGQKTVAGTINNAADAGTKGLAIDCNFLGGGTYTNFNLHASFGGPGYKAAVSCGFWFQMPTAFRGAFKECDLFRFRNPLGDHEPLIKALDDGSGKIFLHTVDESYSPTDIVIATSTWYWATMKYTQSGNAQMRVYDTTGAQVGSEQTRLANAQPCSTFDFGNISGATGAFAGNMYLDNLLIDWTTAAYPLGPGSAANGGGRFTLLGVG